MRIHKWDPFETMTWIMKFFGADYASKAEHKIKTGFASVQTLINRLKISGWSAMTETNRVALTW